MMLRVKDENGNIVPGLFKDSLGAIVVKNDSEYNRYLNEKKQQQTISNLTDQIAELKELVNNLLLTANINKDSIEGH